MKTINLQPFVDLLYANWRYFGSVLFGALTSALIVHNLTKKREKERIKIDLQSKAAEQILDSTKNFSDASSGMSIPGMIFFDSFNSTLKSFALLNEEVGENFNVNRMINEINRNQIEQAKKNIFENMSSYSDLWQQYTKSFLYLLNLLESKEVIFNKFVGIRLLLLDEFTELSAIHNDIMNLYQLKMCSSIINSLPINESLIEELHRYENKFFEKRMDITSIIHDLKVGVQNEFLSKFFKYEVQFRKPTNEGYPVHKPGYIHKG